MGKQEEDKTLQEEAEEQTTSGKAEEVQGTEGGEGAETPGAAGVMADGGMSDEGADGELALSFGDDEPEQSDPSEQDDKAPEWVRELRKTNKELKRTVKSQAAKLEKLEGKERGVPELGPKPKLEDHDYDPESYETALENWYGLKRQHDDAQAKKNAEAAEAQEAWQNKLAGYGKARDELNVADYEDAEASISEILDVTQQGIIVQAAENAPLLVYALHKNPKKAAELAAIKNPVDFAWAAAKLENTLKVNKKRTPPPPEKMVSDDGAKSGGSDTNLNRLREEAAKTGDYSKVIAYKRKAKG